MPKLSSFLVYFLFALVIILITPACSVKSCVDEEMDAWRELHPNASHSEASYRYHRYQLECKEYPDG